MEEQATIEHWHEIGALFGIECAAAAKCKVAEGQRPDQVHTHIQGMIAWKDQQLRSVGGDDIEVAAFMDAAGETAGRTVLIAELFGKLNRHQRRAATRQRTAPQAPVGKGIHRFS